MRSNFAGMSDYKFQTLEQGVCDALEVCNSIKDILIELQSRFDELTQDVQNLKIIQPRFHQLFIELGAVRSLLEYISSEELISSLQAVESNAPINDLLPDQMLGLGSKAFHLQKKFSKSANDFKSHEYQAGNATHESLLTLYSSYGNLLIGVLDFGELAARFERHNLSFYSKIPLTITKQFEIYKGADKTKKYTLRASGNRHMLLQFLRSNRDVRTSKLAQLMSRPVGKVNESIKQMNSTFKRTVDVDHDLIIGSDVGICNLNRKNYEITFFDP